jgi:Abortive infection alpha
MEEITKLVESLNGMSETVNNIYKDGLQPAVQEVGKGLHTLSKTIHIALAPVSALVWGYEKIRDYIQTSLEKKLKNVPEENIITPDPSVAVPAIETLRYTAHKEELREMFSNLIATAMDKETAPKAHPSFVEILKQINPDEAKIIKLLDNDQSKAIVKMRAYNPDNDHYSEPIQEFSLLPYMAGCSYPELGPSYLVNLARLGIANISYESYSTLPNSYEPIFEHPVIKQQKSFIESLGKRAEIMRGTFTRTNFGKKFYEACVLEK